MQKKSFTLIELLIVVAIIGILAAIAIPNFLNARIRAKIAGTQSDLKIFVDAMLQYHMDYNSYHAHRDTEDQHFPLTTPTAYLPHALPDRFQDRADIESAVGYENTQSYYHWIPAYSHEHIWGRAFRRKDAALTEAFRNQEGIVDGWGPAGQRGGPRYDASNGLVSAGGFYRIVPKGSNVHLPG